VTSKLKLKSFSPDQDDENCGEDVANFVVVVVVVVVAVGVVVVVVATTFLGIVCSSPTLSLNIDSNVQVRLRALTACLCRFLCAGNF